MSRQKPTSDYAVTENTSIGRYIPSDEEVYDSHGTRVDEDYVARAVDEVHRALGRPSLSGRGGSSPTVSFRLPDDQRAQAERLAEAEGTTVSTLARRALQRYLAERPGA